MSYVLVIVTTLTAIVWLCLALPTPQEHERMMDSIGKTTGVNWR